jgi:predicted RNA methylase
MVDQFFTPENIASAAHLALGSKKSGVVADFAVGDGSLLKALPFRPTKIIGLDLDSKVITSLRKKFPEWTLSTGDFLNPKKKTQTWLKHFEKKVDVILLNPPFSCKGTSRLDISTKKESIKCRTAMAFIVNALKYLKPSGVLLGILPLSSFKSEADNLVLSYLKKDWSIDFGQTFDSNSFDGCSSKSIIIKIVKRKSNEQVLSSSMHKNNYNFTAEILRGTMPMYKTLANGKYRVLHSTNLREEVIQKGFKYSNVKKLCVVKGELLFIPRVGEPKKNKILIANLKGIYILSDCVFAIKAENLEQLTALKNIVLNNWENFKLMYSSTCAPYISVKQLCNFFESHGMSTLVVEEFNFKKQTPDNRASFQKSDPKIIPIHGTQTEKLLTGT